jgi:hypothetical protein
MQKPKLELDIGDEPVALRFSADATAIVVDNLVISLRGSIEQRQALVMAMARAVGLVALEAVPPGDSSLITAIR